MTRRSSSAQYRRRERRRARGLCILCPAAHIDGYRCARHRAQFLRHQRAWYERERQRLSEERRAHTQAKLALGICGASGCEEPRKWNGKTLAYYCRKHLRRKVEIAARWREKRRTAA